LLEGRIIECGIDASGIVLLISDLQPEYVADCQEKVQRHILMIAQLISIRLVS